MKGGAILHDSKTNRILLVQSRGKLWGIPKGTKDNNETIEECSIREVKEETGLIIDSNNLKYFTEVNNGRSKFYYIPG